MRKVITFLGVRPLKTLYRFQGKEIEAEVFAEVLCKSMDFDQMLVCTTAEARDKCWPVLEKQQDKRITDINIPLGKTSAEMWNIFDAILPYVEPGDRVVFDITHGLRSLPFLVFLFAAYLKTARQVVIEAIYYGALELRSTQPDGAAPVIDLSEFVEMLDWLTATDQFVRTGDGRWLAEMLEKKGVKEKAIGETADSLRAVSNAALMCQPQLLMKTSKTLEHNLRKTAAVILSEVPPFELLRKRITTHFGRFRGGDEAREQLCAQYQLIQWYYETGQLIQAVTLAREWLINAVTWRLELPIDLSPGQRQLMERAVSGVAKVGQKTTDRESGQKYIFSPDDLNTYGRKIFLEMPEKETIKLLWNTIYPLRNAMDHAGHQDSVMSLSKMEFKAIEIKNGLAELAHKWGLELENENL